MRTIEGVFLLAALTAACGDDSDPVLDAATDARDADASGSMDGRRDADASHDAPSGDAPSMDVRPDAVRDGGPDAEPTSDADADRPSDASGDAPRTYDSGIVIDASPGTGRAVDLLFMIDNSNSMSEEQASLGAEMGGFLSALLTGTVGDRTFPAPSSIRVGVVSTDLGAGGATVPTCDDADGDNGELLGDRSGVCDGFMFEPGGWIELDSTDGATAVDAVSCAIDLGTGGCGFEQQLEASLLGISADRNPGFVRDGAVLGIVILTDEEDCSTPEGAELFDPASSTYVGDLNLRCFMYPMAQYAIDRYTMNLLAARDPAEDLVFLAITGLPTDLDDDPGAIDYETVLADPRMQQRVDTASMTPRLVTSCSTPDRGVAFPPRRIVQVAQQLDLGGAGVVMQSICQESYAASFTAFVERIADRLD